MQVHTGASRLLSSFTGRFVPPGPARGPAHLIALLALILALLSLPSVAHGAGELDPTFSGDGKVVTDFGGSENVSGVAIQADGKIVAAGVSLGASPNFALTRYNPDGSLD